MILVFDGVTKFIITVYQKLKQKLILHLQISFYLQKWKKNVINYLKNY